MAPCPCTTGNGESIQWASTPCTRYAVEEFFVARDFSIATGQLEYREPSITAAMYAYRIILVSSRVYDSVIYWRNLHHLFDFFRYHLFSPFPMTLQCAVVFLSHFVFLILWMYEMCWSRYRVNMKFSPFFSTLQTSLRGTSPCASTVTM